MSYLNRGGWFLLLVLLLSCSSLKPAQTITMGVSGRIFSAQGNQMPRKGKPAYTGKGLSCQLYIYKATNTADTDGQSPVFTKINTLLVVKIKSDSTGYYAAKLQPGQYSLFIKDGDRFFANESDGAGALNRFEVKAGELTQRNFRFDIKAVY